MSVIQWHFHITCRAVSGYLSDYNVARANRVRISHPGKSHPRYGSSDNAVQYALHTRDRKSVHVYYRRRARYSAHSFSIHTLFPCWSERVSARCAECARQSAHDARPSLGREATTPLWTRVSRRSGFVCTPRVSWSFSNRDTHTYTHTHTSNAHAIYYDTTPRCQRRRVRAWLVTIA